MAVLTATIGTTGRDYSTPQLWEDALPADLVSDGNARVGAVYNDGGAPLGAVSISAHTTDATNYARLTAAAGQSFVDDANVRTTALSFAAYQATYAGLRATSGYTFAVDLTAAVDYFYLDRLLIETTASTSAPFASTTGCNHMVLRDMIWHTANTSANLGVIWGNNTLVVNLAYYHNSGSGFITALRNNPTFIGCTFARTTTNGVAGTCFEARSYSDSTLISCAVFGYSAVYSGAGTFNAASKNNACDLASGLPGSGNQHSVSYSATTPFTQASNTGTDFRAIAGTALAANGFLDGTNASTDISGTARAASPTIGAWELAAPVTLTQAAYRWRNDDGSESTATGAAAQNTDISVARSLTRRLRVMVQATGNPTAKAFKLQYRKVGGSTWSDV